MKMNKKRWSILITLVFILVLSGCSLAKEDADKEVLNTEEISQDRLIGVVVTDEHLDLFDFDAFLNDNLDKIADGQELDGSGSAKYQGRICATVDKHGSDEPYKWDFIFDGVDGHILISPTMQHEDGEPFHMTEGSDSFSDVNTHYVTTDEGQEIYLNGTIYLQSGKAQNDTVYYLNPVYQTEEGDIYLVGGNGLASNVAGEDGNEMSSKLDGNCNMTVNGVTESYKSSVEIKFITMDSPTKVRFYHMNEKHKALSVQEFVPDEVPEEFKVEEGTAYVLMETEKVNPIGVNAIEREICEPDREGQMTVKVFCPSDDGILIAKYTKITFGS